MKLNLFARFVIIVTVVISATDAIVFWHIQKRGMQMQDITWPFVIEVIIITIVPIVVNLWYWLVFKPRAKSVRQSVILWSCVGFVFLVCWLLVLTGIL
jgi:hypothetical protein